MKRYIIFFAMAFSISATAQRRVDPAVSAYVNSVNSVDSALEVVFQKYLHQEDSINRVRTVSLIKDGLKMAETYKDSAIYFLSNGDLARCIEAIHISNAAVESCKKLTGLKKD